MAAYKNAVTFGIAPAEFWGLTPYLTKRAIPALSDRRNISAWMTANLSRAKKMPPLDKLLHREKQDVKTGLKAALMGLNARKRK